MIFKYTNLLLFSALICYLIILLVSGCVEEKTDLKSASGDYLGSVLPDIIPVLFAEGLVSTSFNERDAAISPDGNEFYYSLIGASYPAIIVIKRADGGWGDPEVASFSGQYSDLEPHFSPNGNRLYFASKRPINGSGPPKDYDIWYVDREGNNWGDPKNIGAPINTEKDEFYPSVTNNGSLYWTAGYDDSKGKEDIYYSRFVNGHYTAPINLGDSINGPNYEFNAFVARDESYLIFSSVGREDGFGGGDLYISFRNKDGIWSGAVNMGAGINSDALDYCPMVTQDGKHMFFTSTRRPGDKYSETPLTYEQIISGLMDPLNGTNNIYWISNRIDSPE